MADFTKAHQVLAEYEGGYSNDPADRGGETYKGIARVFHPSWNGWALIDAAKTSKRFPLLLDESHDLQRLVLELYKREWWDRLALDSISHQGLATEIYEQAVNRGMAGVVQGVQRVCNALNYDRKTGGPIYQDLSVDGRFGGRTLAALQTLIANGDAVIVIAALNADQASHYTTLALANPTQRKFMRGWLKRAML